MDRLQFVVLCGGQLVILAVAMSGIPGDMSGVLDIAREAGRLDFSFSFDPTIRFTVWAILIGGTCHRCCWGPIRSRSNAT